MKSIFIFLLFTSSLFAANLDITRQEHDFRLSAISPTSLADSIHGKGVWVDTTRLTQSKIMKGKFGESVFGLHLTKLDQSNSRDLASLLNSYLNLRENKLGSFFKRSSTVVKVFIDKEIHLFVAHEALRSDLELAAGDVIVLQDLGDLF
jgi:hypothetical protein